MQKPSLTVDVVALAGHGADTRVLLINRGHEPFQGLFAFPGGFVDPFEIPIQAAIRELLEETGLQLVIQDLIPLTLRGGPGRDPRGWTLTQPYLCVLNEVVPVQAGDDATHAQWIRLADVESLAFDHGAILCDALSRFWPILTPFKLPSKTPWSVPHKVHQPTFFGGTFNPWHDGHRACLRLARDRVPGDLIVVPDRSPFKQPTDRFCAWQKFRQCHAQAVEFGASAYPGFLALEHVNPTVSWLTKLPHSQRSFLLGADSLISLPRWVQAEQLVRSLRALYVAPRDSDSAAVQEAEAWVKAINPDIQLTHLPHHEYEDLSSTALREGAKD